MQQIRNNMLKGLLSIFTIFLAYGSVYAQQVLTLEESRELALKHNNRINKARENVNAAESGIEIANTAGRPKLNASASAFYFGEPINELLPEYGITPVLSLTQPIYHGGKIKYGRRMAKTREHME